MRMLEERERAQNRYNSLTEEYELKLREELQEKEDEIECLQSELHESEQMH